MKNLISYFLKIVQMRSRSIRLWIKNLNIDSKTQRTILCNMCLGGQISINRIVIPTNNINIPVVNVVTFRSKYHGWKQYYMEIKLIDACHEEDTFELE